MSSETELQKLVEQLEQKYEESEEALKEAEEKADQMETDLIDCHAERGKEMKDFQRLQQAHNQLARFKMILDKCPSINIYDVLRCAIELEDQLKRAENDNDILRSKENSITSLHDRAMDDLADALGEYYDNGAQDNGGHDYEHVLTQVKGLVERDKARTSQWKKKWNSIRLLYLQDQKEWGKERESLKKRLKRYKKELTRAS